MASWKYAAGVGGIVNTTAAVTLVTPTRNESKVYLTGLLVAHDTLGAVTEFVITDGIGGTVIFRGKLQTTATDTTGGSGCLAFDTPLESSPGQPLQFALVTAVTGGVYVNAQGYTS